jgi:hypothetical protein
MVGSALDEQAKQLFNAGLATIILISSQNRFLPAVTLDHANSLSSSAFFTNSLSLFPINESFKLEYLFWLLELER